MGGKASYCRQDTLRLRRDDGEITEVAIDSQTQVERISEADPGTTVAEIAGPAS